MDRWKQIDRVLESALECEPDQRQAYLDEACVGDEPLRREVESLLAAHDQAGSLFDGPPAALVAEAVGAAGPSIAAIGAALPRLLAAGQTISRYRIIRELGHGGMGEVYLAADPELGRQVALKLLPTSFAADGESVRRFKLEARAASSLNHPNIITIHEIGEVEGLHFIISEFVDGETLASTISQGPLAIEECLTIGRQVADALSEAHRVGIIHRDIKPQNIMLNARGQVKVLDFGLAKVAARAPARGTKDASDSLLSEPGLIVGTVAYMSPEQLRGEALDPRTDIFSFGATLYEMIAGKQPFASDSSAETIAAILTRDPPPLTGYATVIPERLAWIVSRCLQKDRDRRYETMIEAAVELDGLSRRSVGSADKEFPAGLLNRRPGGKESSQGFWRRSRLLHRGLLIPVLVIAALSAAGYEWLARRTTAPESVSRSEARSSNAVINSVAVLPFKPFSEEGREEYIELGLTDAVIEKLGSLGGIVVRPISAVRKYNGLRQDPLAAGRELRVEAVLDANIQKAGDRVRVSARLIRVNDGGLLWSERFDESFKDVLTLEDVISGRVASALTSALTGEQRRLLAKHYTDSSEAYRAYLLGRYYWNKRTKEGLNRAIQYFEQAVTIQPGYALAHAGLADCNVLLYDHLFKEASDSIPQARASAVKALELDDALAEAHTSWAYILWLYDRNWAGAESEFARAIDLNPSYATAHHWYSRCLASRGRFEEALVEIRRAQEIDPLSPVINTSLGNTLTFSGQYDKAIEQLQMTLEMQPDFEQAYWELGNAYQQKQMNEQTIAAYQRAIELSGDPRLAGRLGQTYHRSGFAAAMLTLTGEWKRQAGQFSSDPYSIGRLLALAGDKEGAFEWLEKAYKSRHPWLIQMKVDPLLCSLHSDPKFDDLLRRMRIPQP